MADEKPEVVFGAQVSDDEQKDYRARIAAARTGVSAMKGREQVGVVPKAQLPTRAVEEGKLASSISATGGVAPRPPGSPLLSPETAQQIKGLADAQVKEQAQEQPAEAKPEEKEDPFDLFDFGQRNEADRVLNNKKRRAAIEERCAPMSLDDLVMKDEVRQVVPILPGKLEVLYRSMTPEENLFIKRYVARDQSQSDQYLMEKFALCQLTCSLVAINGNQFIDHLNSDGSVADDMFEKKLATICRKSGYLVADLGINYAWFDIRVRKLLNPDTLGNG